MRTHEIRGGVGSTVVDVVWYLSIKEHLSVAHYLRRRPSGLSAHISQELRCVAALIARVVSCSDFRLASHVSYSRTERHLSLRQGARVTAGTTPAEIGPSFLETGRGVARNIAIEYVF